MGKALADFGMQLGQGVLGAGMGILLGKQADKRQISQQRKLQDMQIQGQRQMMDYSYEKQMQMWKDTNYGAQKEMLKEAGLNPGLLYGMGGGGGTTTGGAGASVQGGTAPTGGSEPIHMAGMAMNLGLLRAQKENIEADTANKRAEVPVKEGTVPKLKAETENIQVQTKIAKIEAEIKGATLEEAIKIVTAQMAILQEQVHQEEVKTGVARGTQNVQIDRIKAELAATLITNELTGAQIKTEKGKPAVQTQEIASMKAHITAVIQARMQKWVEIEYSGTDKKAHERFALMKQAAEEMNAPMDLVEKVIQAIILRGVVAPKPTPVDPRFKTHWRTDVGNIK